MAKTYPCDMGCGEVADVQTHIISTTEIMWLCPGCQMLANARGTAELPDAILAQVGLIHISSIPTVTTEDGPAPAPAERPQPEQGEEPAAGTAGAEVEGEDQPAAPDQRGDDRVAAGGGAGAKPEPAATEA